MLRVVCLLVLFIGVAIDSLADELSLFDADASYSLGYDDGYGFGYDQGLRVGEKTGRQEGKFDGREEGYDSGWEEAYQPAYDQAYDRHFTIAYGRGYDESFSLAYEEGAAFAEDYRDGLIHENALFAVTPGGSVFTPNRPRPGSGSYGSSLVITMIAGPGDRGPVSTRDEAWYYDSGYADGKEVGGQDGYAIGYNAAYAPAYSAAFEIAYDQGLSQGALDGAHLGLIEGHNEGWGLGVGIGDQDGFASGFYESYGDAWNDLEWGFAGAIQPIGSIHTTQFFVDRVSIDPWALGAPIPEPTTLLLTATCMLAGGLSRR